MSLIGRIANMVKIGATVCGVARRLPLSLVIISTSIQSARLAFDFF